MFLFLMLANRDEEVITIIEHMNNLFSKRNKEPILGNASDPISSQQFLSFLIVIILMDDRLVSLEDDGKGLADSDADGDGCNELDLGAGLNCHLYLLEDHQQLRL
jgi:hypothetical protein